MREEIQASHCRNDSNSECGHKELERPSRLACSLYRKLTQRFFSPSPVLMNGQGYLNP